VKERFKNAAEQSAFDTYGIAFGRALELFCDGGRAARLESKLDRVVKDAESLLSQLDEDQDDGGLSVVERKTVVICNRLGEQFTDAELVSEVHEVAATGPRAAPQTIKRYREIVTDRLDVQPQPIAEQNPNVKERIWVPAAEAEELAPDGEPEECRLPVDLLDDTDRIRRIRLSIGKRAAETPSGEAGLTAEDVQNDVLCDELSKNVTLGLMEEAAMIEGYRLTRRGDTATLHVHLETVQADAEDLFREIIKYRDSESDDLVSDPTGTTMSDFTDQPESSGKMSGSTGNTTGTATDGGGSRSDDVGDELDEYLEKSSRELHDYSQGQ